MKDMNKDDHVKAQLGLGHSYSRAKVKFNVNRSDNMIIQSISLLDTLDKDINTFSMRVKEWYSWHFPELVKIIPDNYTYSKVVKLVKNKANITENMLDELEAIPLDRDKAQEVIDATSTSMGTDISDLDMMNIALFADKVIKLADYRESLHAYLQTRMNDIAPNLSTLIGEQVGARLISHAGSLVNLAKYPASTVQILGAEKALFRALKTKGNTPKYGLIFHSSFIGRASVKNKGRIARYLANKTSMAARIDAFSETPTIVFGTKLNEQVEERLNFYDSGKVPRKNLDVMLEAIESVEKTKKESEDQMELDNHDKKDTGVKKEKKKKKKRKRESMKEDGEKKVVPSSAPVTPVKTEESPTDPPATEGKKKRKKKKKKRKKSLK